MYAIRSYYDIDDSSKALTKSIVSFAKELNIKTIAEHVDRVEIYDFVKSIGIRNNFV